ncbi:uncharacterized protein EURHEDRAFT_407701 [Aspergillus ruber CBS 135680]|uniref:Lincomycin-condensing protein lmbA n=1 Tax=Aspergillus ruber (strain CBS 135680) TaxID=1388766 RepID=A0A017SRW3_ASPRC|nr:uncharacterized protein EURHEDRAFT_407701 [Aspergillus ruber CBS 135680]EYE99708.1 hypothetical protein EURHEDRAFT_407701 [Aspergillus ruber CBS 135680]
MSFLSSILPCLFGDVADTSSLTTTTNHAASNIITAILTSPTTVELQKTVNEQVAVTGWTDSLVEAILRGLTTAVEAGAALARPAADALKKATDAAIDFKKDHPVYATLIALGILFVLLPWVLELLGFTESGVSLGSWAARWQKTYHGYVPKRALFGYFQRMGAKWHWSL